MATRYPKGLQREQESERGRGRERARGSGSIRSRLLGYDLIYKARRWVCCDDNYDPWDYMHQQQLHAQIGKVEFAAALQRQAW